MLPGMTDDCEGACPLCGDGDACLSPTSSWTGLRAAMALLIFLEHVCVQPLAFGGLFFMLSGCMLASTDSSRIDSLGQLARFQARRLARIFPAYWVALAVRVANIRYHRGHGFSSLLVFFTMPIEHPADFFAFQSWGFGKHTYLWFVSTIVAMFMVLPLLEYALTQLGARSSLHRAIAIGSGCYLLQLIEAAYILTSPDMDPSHPFTYTRYLFRCKVAFYVNPVVRLPLFVLGITTAHGLRALEENDCQGGGWADLQHALRWATDVAAGAVLALVVIARAMGVAEWPASHPVHVASRMQLESPLFALIVFGLAGSGPKQSASGWLLTSRVALKLGEWSYGMYLWHPIVASFLGCFVVHQPEPTCRAWDLIAAYSISAGLSCMSFYLVEDPARKLVRWATEPSRLRAEVPQAMEVQMSTRHREKTSSMAAYEEVPTEAR